MLMTGLWVERQPHNVTGIGYIAARHAKTELGMRVIGCNAAKQLIEVIFNPVAGFDHDSSCIEVVNVIHSRRKLPASPPHAGHRCGTTVVRRRRGRVWRLSRIGIWQPSQHQTTPTISATTW